MDYKSAGVDIGLGDDASKILYEAAQKTFENRAGNIGEIIVPFDDFSGVRAIDVSNLPEGSLMCLGFDGVGTKVEVAQRVDNHSTIAHDLFAMVCDDAVVRGAEPVLLGTVLDVNTLNGGLEKVKQLAKGYVEAAKEANVAVINGEIAELGEAVGGYGDFNYNWCAGLVWFADKKKLLTGKDVSAGDSIVLLQEEGFRSNGLSLVRKILEKNHGKDWHTAELNGKTLGELVLHPSKIYSRFIVHLHGGFQREGCCPVHAVAHITGGGLPGKLARALKPSGLGAEIQEPFEPCEMMRYCQEKGSVDDKEAYRTWNMGQGMAIMTPEPERVVREAEKFGINAKKAGLVTKEPGIRIKSRGVSGQGVLEFPD